MKRVAIISGASSGIGKTFAISADDRNYDEIWAIARNQERLEDLAKMLETPVKPISLDLTKEESFTKFAEILAEEKPDVKLLINASGFGIFKSVEDMKMEDAEGMIDLNCKALVKMTKLTLPYMAYGAKIIQIASIASFQPIPYVGVYGASKAFVLSFSRALNREISKRGIHSMAVCPYWTKTNFFARADQDNEEAVVKKYVVMYEPEQIVNQAWKDLAKNKDVSIYGAIAKGQALMVKLMPHKVVMDIWQKQQDLS